MPSKETYFAKVIDGIVVDVMVADQQFINSGMEDNPRLFIETCPDTFANTHPEGTPLRKNYAGIGYTYDPVRDAFIPPKTYPSWILNEDTCQWDPPKPQPYPNHAYLRYVWDENILNWRCTHSQQDQEFYLAPETEEERELAKKEGYVWEIFPWICDP